jgi:long-chain acyl-CoA synthetase
MALVLATAQDHSPWLRHLDYPDLAIWQLLERTAQRFPDRPALRFFGRTTTYRQLMASVERFAQGLVASGVRPGDRVALVLPNAPQMVIAYYGAMRAGALVVPTNPLYTPREFGIQMRDAEPRAVVALDLVVPRLKDEIGKALLVTTRIRDYLPPLLGFLQGLREKGPEMPRESISLERLLGAGQGATLPEPGSADDVALLQYTGGTTGVPKAAMLSHRNLVANALQAEAWMPSYQAGQERVLAVLPFFHVFGMTVALNLGILTGAEIDLVPRFNPEETAREVRRFKPTLFPGAPAMYQAVADSPHVERWNIRSIRYCISGSAPLPLELQERFERLTGGVLVEGYGLTEASPVTHCNPLGGERRSGTVGRTFPDTLQRILDPENPTRELPPGEVGELAVKGPQVMLGYWGPPAETAAVLQDGWLRTGDLGMIDEDGYCSIVDRKKDVIIVSGFNVYPREVEEVLLRHPGVREAVVVGVPDERRGQVVRAVVVPWPDRRPTVEELQAYCRERLAGYKTPRQFELREELPRTAIGKVLRRVLVAEATEQKKEE